MFETWNHAAANNTHHTRGHRRQNRPRVRQCVEHLHGFEHLGLGAHWVAVDATREEDPRRIDLHGSAVDPRRQHAAWLLPAAAYCRVHVDRVVDLPAIAAEDHQALRRAGRQEARDPQHEIVRQPAECFREAAAL